MVDLCIPVVLHGLQGHICLTMVFTMGCKGDLNCSAWSISSPSFSTGLGACTVLHIASHVLTLFFSGHNCICTIMFFSS